MVSKVSFNLLPLLRSSLLLLSHSYITSDLKILIHRTLYGIIAHVPAQLFTFSPAKLLTLLSLSTSILNPPPTPHLYYSLFIIHYSLFTTYYLLFTTYYSLLTTHYLLLTTHHSPLTIYHPPFTIRYSGLFINPPREQNTVSSPSFQLVMSHSTSIPYYTSQFSSRS